MSEGKVRVDSVRVSKPSRAVGPGNTLTFAQGDSVRVVRITALPVRRGPAAEAQGCYEDLSPPATGADGPEAADFGGRSTAGRKGPRPTKKDRRNLSDF